MSSLSCAVSLFPLAADDTGLASSPSLASRLSAFAPPLADPQRLTSAALAQASAELAALAEAACCAAAACPETTPLVESLCGAVADELVALKASQASNRKTDCREAAVLIHRVEELRSATADGLQAIRAALGETCAETVPAVGFGGSASESSLQQASLRAPPPSLLQERSGHSKEKEMATLFGTVASNMKQAVLEIREAKAFRAATRTGALMLSSS